MKLKKREVGKSDLDRDLTVKKEDLKQITVKTGLRAGVRSPVLRTLCKRR